MQELEAVVAQAPVAAQELEAGESSGSKSSKKSSSKRSSRMSQGSEEMSSIRAELIQGGVPSGAVRTLARQGVTLKVLKSFSVAWRWDAWERRVSP